MAFLGQKAVLIAAMLVFPNPLFAAPDYSAGDIVQTLVRFSSRGAARGICIGTVEECKAQTSPSPGLDIKIDFDYDSSRLTANARENLLEIAKALKNEQLAPFSFVVEGHTDARGTEEYNQKLSERRARSVRAFLVRHGVARKRIYAIGVGKSDPRSENSLDAINRRVEIHVNLTQE